VSSARNTLEPLRVAVIGVGHVGLVTCVTLAKLGHSIVGCDSDEERIEQLRRGHSPFHEPMMQELLEETAPSGRLDFTTKTPESVATADVIFICVGTPARASGEANLMAVEAVTRTVGRHARSDAVIVEKSTVPAGTSERIRRTLELDRSDRATDMHVVSNPEFLREGRAIQDSLKPDRILIGTNGGRASAVMRRLYAPLIDRGHPLIEVDIATAELAKHACNAFLALKISYANALARICENAGADVVAVAEVMGSDPRIGRAFLDAGLGYGGYCFPKDLVAFQKLAEQCGSPFPLLREVARINAEAIDAAASKIREALWNIEGKTIAMWGLSFKPNTDDVRFSPAVTLAKKLLEEGATVIGYDPEAAGPAKAELPELELASDALAAVTGAHCLVVCTEWDEFRSVDLEAVRALMHYSIVIDARNVFDPETMRNRGFTYFPTGRPASMPRSRILSA
jgi:UDPglucose 6-dehydrogenase